MSHVCPVCGNSTDEPPPAAYPPAKPLRLSEYGLVARRGGEHGRFMLERKGGGTLTHYDMEIGQALAGGFPVDHLDAGWQAGGDRA